jgi:hypothetical protein
VRRDLERDLKRDALDPRGCEGFIGQVTYRRSIVLSQPTTPKRSVASRIITFGDVAMLYYLVYKFLNRKKKDRRRGGVFT